MNFTFDFEALTLNDSDPRPRVDIVDSFEGPVLTLSQTELEVIANSIVAGMKEDHPDELTAKKWILMPRYRLTEQDWRFLIMKIKSNDGSILDKQIPAPTCSSSSLAMVCPSTFMWTSSLLPSLIP